jgi:hypothetical protein
MQIRQRLELERNIESYIENFDKKIALIFDKFVSSMRRARLSFVMLSRN